MSIQTNSPPAPINHPPLAHDPQGCKVPVPGGTTHWRILRFTGGRPRLLPGRFDLELTAEQLAEMFGPGKYRVEALDEYGRPLAEVATIIVGTPSETPLTEPVANHNLRPVSATNDSRIMLETIAQMSRAHSESLQSLANAQAEWVKALATAKQIPRNAGPGFTPQHAIAPTPSDGELEAPWWVHLLKPQTLMAVNGLLRNVGTWFGGKQPAEPTEKPRNGSALAQIAERASSAKESSTGLDPKSVREAFNRAYESIHGKKPDDDSTENDS